MQGAFIGETIVVIESSHYQLDCLSLTCYATMGHCQRSKELKCAPQHIALNCLKLVSIN